MPPVIPSVVAPRFHIATSGGSDTLRDNPVAMEQRRLSLARTGLMAAAVAPALVIAVACLRISAAAADPTDTLPASNHFSINELQNALSQHGQIIRSFSIEGVVCAVLPEKNFIVLQDDSAAALLRLPSLDASIRPGQCLAVIGDKCLLTRSHIGIEVATAPVVDNDGNHGAMTKSGKIFLSAGRQPVRLAWYNGDGALALRLEYQGPGIRRQKIPEEALWHKPVNSTAANSFERGLRYLSYVGPASPVWARLPDFAAMKPAAEGIAASVDMMYRVRDHNAALLFTGYLEITNPGAYTFYLNSDDGSRFDVGDPASYCKLLPLGRRATPVARKFGESMTAQPPSHQWTEFEGVVTFASESTRGLELELSARGERVQALVIDSAGLPSANLPHRLIHGIGLCELAQEAEARRRAFLVVPSSAQIQIRGPSKDAPAWDVTDTVLSSAEQIMGLKREESRQGIQAKISGVITWASANAVVIQDATAGIYVHFFVQDWTAQPKVGELWEIQGKTDCGDFSPVIRASQGRYLGNGLMPEPIRPTWDQLMNGSLDAQYVEVHGAVTSIAENAMTLLTPGGKLRIIGSTSRPLPCAQFEAFEPIAWGSEALAQRKTQWLLDSVVRIRGCFTAQWDPATRQLKAGEVFISPAMVSIEQAAPLDPFSLPPRRASDLLLFDANASALQRTKIAGQVIHAESPQYFLYDGQIGVRVLARDGIDLRAGDLVEAVGFPQLGGPSPVLQEARMRRVGSAPLPEPVSVTANELLSGRHDSKLVRVEATLVNDTTYGGQRSLELQAGARHFAARLKADPKLGPLEAGTRVEIVGVCASTQAERGTEPVNAFALLLNDFGAVRILRQPPWLTPQRAIILAAALGGGLAAALVWVTLLRRKVEERTRQLQKQIEARQLVEQRRAMEEERARVAQDLHDELGAGLTEVSILGSLAKNPAIPAEKKDVYLDQLTDAARSLITELDEIVWAVNPHYDSVASLASYYSLFAQRFLNLAGIACRLEIAEQFPDHALDSKLRHGIFLAFKEALNNVVRHSGATEVELKIEVARDRLLIVVSDNGCGLLSKASAPGHDGLQSMSQRLQKLGGTCHIRSEPGCGTTVELQLPLFTREAATISPSDA